MMDKVVAYAGTRNLYEQMYVCLKSLLINNPVDKVYLLIEDDEFPYEVPGNVIPFNISEQEYFPKGSPNYDSPWSYMTLIRCAFGNMFPDEHRILWLDCDTIVDDNIMDLFGIDMDGFFYAGAMEPMKSKGIFTYINAGVLLCNLDLLRLTNKEIELIAFLNGYKFAYPDQDVINMLCQGRIRIIGSEYNTNDYTLSCTRPKIYHFAAVKNFKYSWAYRKYKDAPLFAEEKADE